MSAAPFMPLFVADYLGDTQHLTTEQHGAYLLLLMAMWRAGGVLPNDPLKIARIARVSAARWRRIGGDVMALLTVSSEGVTQKRLASEIEKSKEISAKRAHAGAAGAAAKILKRNEVAQANASGLLGDTRAGFSQPQSEKEKKDAIASNAREPSASVDTEFEREFYPVYPHKIGKAAARKAWRTARRKAEAPVIIAGLHRYIASKPPDREWCNPATFLNQERWQDEPAPAAIEARQPHVRPSPHDTLQAAAASLVRRRSALADGGADGDAGELPGLADEPGNGGGPTVALFRGDGRFHLGHCPPGDPVLDDRPAWRGGGSLRLPAIAAATGPPGPHRR